MNRPIRTLLLAAAMAIALALPAIAPRAEPFTFQGHLAQSGTPLDGTADLAFKLYNADTGGAQLGSTISTAGYPVVDGVFSVDLDFSGIAFDGSARWLQIEVNGTPLSGRIEILPAPLSASSNALRGRSVAATAPTAGQVLEWSGSSWTPTTPSTGTTYSAGTGLALATGSFSVAPTFRLPQGCSNNQIASWNGSAWVCAVDASASYSAGNGLTLSGSSFSVNFAGSGAANAASRSDHDHFGQTWFGSSQHGLYIANSETTGSPTGIFGVESAGSNSGAGVRGLSSNGKGVSGQGVTGVYGHTVDPSGKGVWGAGGEIGVLGESAGVAGIGVHGRALHASGVVSGVRGETSSSLGNGVQGNNTSTSGGSGVYGLSVAALGRGVLGVNSATTGDAAGVYGQTASGAGYGVVGYNTGITGSGAGVRGISEASAGVGVFGKSETGMEAEGQSMGLDAVALDSAGQALGVRASSGSPDGAGVFAINSSATGNAFAAYAQTNSTAGTALVGDALATTGSNFGALARTASGSGTGLRAENTATSGAGSGNALVAVGNLPSGDTMVVEANGTGSAWAIRATSAGSQVINAQLTSTTTPGSAISATADSATGRAGEFVNFASGGQAAQFIGNVDVTGTLSKGGGSFKIDHPLDPANKFLLHSFVESPDMMNVYNGNIVTDARGYASIDLPDWFEALNRDFRYQLTVIGSFARAMVAEEVHGNRFAIRTETPNTKVSWQVTGIRRDPWAEKNRIPVEVEKAPAERGKYLHPEVHGAPAGKRIGVESTKNASRLAPTTPVAGLGKLP